MHMEKRGSNPTYDLDNAILSRTTVRPKPAYELVQVRRAEPTPTFEFDLKCYRVPRANKFERLENRYPEVEKRGFNPNGLDRYSDRYTDRFPDRDLDRDRRNDVRNEGEFAPGRRNLQFAYLKRHLLGGL